ncbi:redox-sensing transcriptional repressor Rex [Candidatus Margulisiibacteriota bacterium]
MSQGKLPEASIERLSTYYRRLSELNQEGVKNIFSGQLGEQVGVSGDQVRKDLSYIGSFGSKGSGYAVKLLCKEIANILGLQKERRMALLGVGNLGKALLSYHGLERWNFEIVAVFDNNSRKVGKLILGKKCQHPLNLEKVVKEKRIDIAILAVPAAAAQEAADSIVRAGIKVILNFVPVALSVPGDVKVEDVDFSVKLKKLSYFLQNI